MSIEGLLGETSIQILTKWQRQKRKRRSYKKWSHLTRRISSFSKSSHLYWCPWTLRHSNSLSKNMRQNPLDNKNKRHWNLCIPQMNRLLLLTVATKRSCTKNKWKYNCKIWKNALSQKCAAIIITKVAINKERETSFVTLKTFLIYETRIYLWWWQQMINIKTYRYSTQRVQIPNLGETIVATLVNNSLSWKSYASKNLRKYLIRNVIWMKVLCKHQIKIITTDAN